MFKAYTRHLSLLLAVCFILLLVAASVSGTRPVTATRKHYPANLTDVPILNYHKVDGTIQHCLSLTPDEFEQQMRFLSENGYHTITPDQLLAYLKYGKSLPDNPILITFDDGYQDNYTNAYPIMKKYGFTATIFLITGVIDKDPRYMTWDQARALQQDGFVFGSHTVTHAPLAKLTNEQITEELTASKKEIERQLGRKPDFFAYPTGSYTMKIEELVRQAGYRAAFTIRYGQAGLGSDLYALERIPIFHGAHSFRSFYIRLRGAPILERMGIIRN